MHVFNLAEMFSRLAPAARLLGLDPGARRIGLALSDVSLLLASPYGSLARRRLKENAAEITVLAAREGVGGLVVGWPLALDGEEGPAAQSARDWAGALAEATGLPVTLWDERFSTAAALRMLIEEADLSRKRRAEATDRVAAALMLQGALDAHRAA
ncbi:MAG: Holliday junction resolvase RuvX [Rhodospirillales bacterium]|nr:Holliday junction resolvase RuvX [Rhodospirillales bacterium]